MNKETRASLIVQFFFRQDLNSMGEDKAIITTPTNSTMMTNFLIFVPPGITENVDVLK